MTALAIALGWIGTLAAVCFVLWMRRGMDDRTALMEFSARMVAVESALASPQTSPCYWDGPRIKRLEDTVSVLALGAGLKQKPPPEQVKG